MVRLIAHRGFAEANPENTLTAVRRSARVADAIEIDVRRCGSGEPVVIHDETVDRVADGTGPVGDHSLAELQSLDVLGTGEGVPTLRDVLDILPADVVLNVELKEAEIATDALALATAADSEVFVSSFLPEALAAAREAAPDVPRALLFTEGPTAAVETARELGCTFLHPHHDHCTRAFVSRAHEAGFIVNAWTVRDHGTARSLLSAGADGLIVDDPAVVP